MSGSKSSQKNAPAAKPKRSGGLSTLLLLVAVGVAVLSAVIHTFPTTVFDEHVLKEIAQKAIASNPDNATLIVQDVIQAIRKRWYSILIANKEEQRRKKKKKKEEEEEEEEEEKKKTRRRRRRRQEEE